MSQHIFTSYISEDTTVYVEFDYSPQEPEVNLDENITITAVHLVDGEDIIKCLNDKTITHLTEEAYDYVYKQKKDAFDTDPFGEVR